MMNCKQATQLLSKKMDRKLTSKEKLTLKMHIMMCPACRKFGFHMDDIRSISSYYVKKNITQKNK